ncbi:MAG: conserved repeat domain protein, partial [Polaromonas sp.]|nr:conserved repeat domain protein [Polaromonas sp.]
ATPVVFNQKVCVIVQEFIPGTAQMGYSNDVTVQASFTYGNASPVLPTASYTLHDITTMGSSTLELKKEVRNVTQGVLVFGVNNLAKSGETLEYRITYTNNAPTPITNLMVNDTTPVYTSFVSSTTGTTPATLTACTKNTPFNPSPALAVNCTLSQTGASSTGSVNWKFTGSLNPGGIGDVLFQVKVD